MLFCFLSVLIFVSLLLERFDIQPCCSLRFFRGSLFAIVLRFVREHAVVSSGASFFLILA